MTIQREYIIEHRFFKGINNAYWKENMYVNLILVDKHQWVEINNVPFIPKNEVDNFVNLPSDWTNDETKKASYD